MEYVSAAIGIVGVILAVVFFFAGRKTKRLHYYTVVEQPLLQMNPAYKTGNVTVLVDGQQVTHPRTMVIRVLNSGRTEVRPEDYASPITLEVLDAPLMSLDVQGGPDDPGPVEPTLSFVGPGLEHAEVALPAMLLNPGDYLDVMLLLDSDEPVAYEVRGRIAGARLLPGEPGARRRAALLVVGDSVISAVLGGRVAGSLSALTKRTG